jgi:hypothetical protein
LLSAPQSVIKRLMTDAPFGVLLSGGLDSSLVASVTKRHLVETEAAKKFGTELHSFVVGLEVLITLSHPAATRVFQSRADRGALTFFWLLPAGTFVPGIPGPEGRQGGR